MGRARVFVWSMALAVGVAATAAAGLAVLVSALPEMERARLWSALGEQVPLAIFLALLVALTSTAAARWFVNEYVHPALALAEQIDVVRSANGALPIATEGGRELACVAAAAGRLASAYRELRAELDTRVADAARRLEEERNRLAALMAELSSGVVVCSADGRILLYNEQARRLFASAGAAPPLGLGRSIFAFIDREHLVHALEKLRFSLRPGAAPPVSHFVVTAGGGRLLRIRAAPVFEGEQVAGTVLTFDDVTAVHEGEVARRLLLEAIARGARARVAALRAAAENLSAFPDMEPERRGQFIGIVATEAGRLSEELERALRAYADALKAAITLEDMAAADLLALAARRLASSLGLGVEVGPVEEGLWLRVDSYALTGAFLFLAAKLAGEHAVRRLSLQARSRGGLAEIDLGWHGAIVPSDAVPLWEHEPMGAGLEQGPLTLRDVLERHAAEVWLHVDAPDTARAYAFRFVLPRSDAVPPPALPRASRAGSRPEYYDFDLFRSGDPPRELQGQPLAQLSYTVFDTETTGLQPSAGDEIVSIGAARIVNGRLLRGEVFEQLVNPRRPLDPASVRVHGIDASMLVDHPPIEPVLRAFHRFCEDTVLVAHNAAFDMRFIELKEAAAGVRFTAPVLDTLILSVLAQPNQDDHRLEAIAERLGVAVVGRHTALGDALLTGEVFLRLLPLLAERGIHTLGEALAASRETYYARLQY